jgi:hypothetical protein
MRRVIALTVVAAALVAATGASGHLRTISGGFRLEVGWVQEPAYVGSVNAIEVAVSDPRSGAPVLAPNSLVVQVSYGDRRISLPLQPSDEQPGTFTAPLEPTAAGTYAFHVSGAIRGRQIDVVATCSERTFDCVSLPSAIQFPATVPTADQQALAVSRALQRAQDATDSAGTSRTIAVVALVLAVLAVIVLVVVLRRTGSR